MEWSHKGEVRMGICKVISLWNLISNEWFFMWNKWLVLKKKGRERKKDMTTTILNCKENVNEKKNPRRVLYVIRRKECMWSGEKKRVIILFLLRLHCPWYRTVIKPSLPTLYTNINRYIDKEAEEELTAIIPLVNTTTVSLWTAGVLLRPYLTLPYLIRDQPDRLRYNVY